MKQTLRSMGAGTLACLLAGLALAQSTERVSVANDWGQGNHQSESPALSEDGRYVTFHSRASNLVPGDTNGDDDVFVRDRVAGTTERMSIDSNGMQGNDESRRPVISADGRYVAFQSRANNLVPGDLNGDDDVFVRDRVAGTTERVSVANDGTQGTNDSEAPSISADGRYVAFHSSANNLVHDDTNTLPDVFVRDRVAGTTERVSVAGDGTQGNSSSHLPSISSDGRFVAFASLANNLVPGDANLSRDVFLRDRVAGTTERVSVASDGTQGNAMSDSASVSGDGRYVAFRSYATNLVPGDTNSAPDIFVRDRVAGTTVRVSVASDGTQGNDQSFSIWISADGRYVAFSSYASNLVPGDTNMGLDVFVRDRVAETTERVSVASGGTQANSTTSSPSISTDGRYVAFMGLASNLAPCDTNSVSDVFVRDREAPPPASPFCYGDGSGTPCPCGNTGVVGHGCGNGTFPAGTLLSGLGSASVSADNLALAACRSASGQSGLFFQGDSAVQGGSGAQFGDGLRCAGSGLVRLQTRSADSGGIAITTVAIGAAGGVGAGDVKRYQWWYRDPSGSPCLTGFNFSNGLEVTWGP